MRFFAILMSLALGLSLAAEEPEADPAKLPTPAAAEADEYSGSVIIVGYKGAAKPIPGVSRTKDEARARAGEALKEARAKGVSFYDVVAKFSDDPRARGSVGVLPVGKCSIPQLEAALAGMNFGQVSDVVECDLGFLVVLRLAPRAAASHVLVAWAGAERAAATVKRTKEEARELADKVLARVTGGEDFAKVAGELSDCPSKSKGGSLGTFGRGQMTPEFEDTAFALAPGQLSGVIETPFGFHVLKGQVVEVPVTWRASHILVRWKGTERCPPSVTLSKEEARKRIEELIAKLAAGEDFAKLAAEASDCPSKAKGGDLGSFGPGQMVPPFESALKALEVGALSGVVETQFGFHVIKRTR